MSEQNKMRPWYKQAQPWILTAGPISVVITSVPMFFVAKDNMANLVTNDYYKDGRHIGIQLRRDEEAVRRKVRARLLVSPDYSAVKVFVNGDFDAKQPLNLLLMHPVKKTQDQTVRSQPVLDGQGKQTEYSAVFEPLPPINHWYIRIENVAGVWRVESRWIVSQGGSIDLTPMDKLLGSSGNVEAENDTVK